MKSLCLNVELEGHDHDAISEDAGAEGQEDADRALYEALAADARKTEEDAANALDSIAAELGELMGESELNDTDTNDLIGEGEEPVSYTHLRTMRSGSSLPCSAMYANRIKDIAFLSP